MSRAFVKEPDGSEAFDERPERVVSEHPNLVTAEGLRLIEAEVERFSKAYAEAQATGERAALSDVARELRYWSQRRATADVVAKPADLSVVRFGALVTLERQDGKRLVFRIVGEDEADPKVGKLSYVSPMARALLGRALGDEVNAGGHGAEITDIDW